MEATATTLIGLGMVFVLFVLPPASWVYLNATKRGLQHPTRWGLAVLGCGGVAIALVVWGHAVGIVLPTVAGLLYYGYVAASGVDERRSAQERAQEKNESDYEHKHSWYR